VRAGQWWTRRESDVTSINIPVRSGWPEGTRTMADEPSPAPDPTPHVHWHAHPTRHAHEHVHPDDHAHSARIDISHEGAA
jgi:hypothetical protein